MILRRSLCTPLTRLPISAQHAVHRRHRGQHTALIELRGVDQAHASILVTLAAGKIADELTLRRLKLAWLGPRSGGDVDYFSLEKGLGVLRFLSNDATGEHSLASGFADDDENGGVGRYFDFSVNEDHVG